MEFLIQPLWGDDQLVKQIAEDAFRLPLGGCLVQIRITDSQSERVLCNGEPLLPIGPSGEYLKVCTIGKYRKFIFDIRLPSERSVRREISEDPSTQLPEDLLVDLANFESQLRNWLSFESPTIGSLLSALTEGRLTLLQRVDPQSAINKNWKLDAIGQALPSLFLICQNPKLHLVVEEAVRPIEAVRRTGPAALRHLALHSEHWEAKTFTGLRPIRLLAQVIEDDWNLYENRFAITLLRRVSKELQRIESIVQPAHTQAMQSINLMYYRDSLAAFRSSRDLLDLLLPEMNEDRLFEGYDELDALAIRLRLLREQTFLCRETRFHLVLRNCLDVLPPIRPTNILLMEPRYRALYDLWQVLDNSENEIQQSGSGEVPEDLTSSYSKLCQVVFLAALHTSGFIPLNKQLILLDDSGTNFRSGGVYRRGHWQVSISVDSNLGQLDIIKLQWRRLIESQPFQFPNGISLNRSIDVEGRYRIQGSTVVFYDAPTPEEKESLKRLISFPKDKWRTTQWRKFIEEISRKAKPAERYEQHLIPVLTRIGPDDPNLKVNTERLLRWAKAHSLEHGVSTVLLTPSTLRTIGHSDVLPSVVGRLRNYGDSFQGDDAGSWGNYQVGMLPITREHLHSLFRLIHLIQLQTWRRDFEAGRWPDQCPVCLHPGGAKEPDSTSFVCRDLNCGTNWGITACKRKAQCGKSYAWIRPRWRDKQQAENTELNYATWFEAIEEIPNPQTGISPMPAYCQSQDKDRFRFPICPHCGYCSQQSTLSEKCARCADIKV